MARWNCAGKGEGEDFHQAEPLNSKIFRMLRIYMYICICAGGKRIQLICTVCIISQKVPPLPYAALQHAYFCIAGFGNWFKAMLGNCFQLTPPTCCWRTAWFKQTFSSDVRTMVEFFGAGLTSLLPNFTSFHLLAAVFPLQVWFQEWWVFVCRAMASLIRPSGRNFTSF